MQGHRKAGGRRRNVGRRQVCPAPDPLALALCLLFCRSEHIKSGISCGSDSRDCFIL